MLLERASLLQNGSGNDKPKFKKQGDSEQPLTCMLYLFASQMQRHIKTSASGTDEPVHALDALIKKIGMHATYSPLVTKFDIYPVEIPQTPQSMQRGPIAPASVLHDSMLIMKFRNKRAREEWIATREWQEFMDKTEAEGVFRRIPHVRCARSLKGLMDPIDVLTA